MAYTKHTWENGEVITAEKLNNLEDGIAESSGSNITVFNIIEDGETDNIKIDATWQDIFDAISERPVFLKWIASEDDIAMYVVTEVVLLPNEGYAVLCVSYGGVSVIGFKFTAESSNSYPVSISD